MQSMSLFNARLQVHLDHWHFLLVQSSYHHAFRSTGRQSSPDYNEQVNALLYFPDCFISVKMLIVRFVEEHTVRLHRLYTLYTFRDMISAVGNFTQLWGLVK